MIKRKQKKPYPVVEHRSATDEEVLEWLSRDFFPIKPPPLIVGPQTLELLNDLMEREYGKAAEQSLRDSRRRNVSKLPPRVRKGIKMDS